MERKSKISKGLAILGLAVVMLLTLILTTACTGANGDLETKLEKLENKVTNQQTQITDLQNKIAKLEKIEAQRQVLDVLSNAKSALSVTEIKASQMQIGTQSLSGVTKVEDITLNSVDFIDGTYDVSYFAQLAYLMFETGEFSANGDNATRINLGSELNPWTENEKCYVKFTNDDESGTLKFSLMNNNDNYSVAFVAVVKYNTITKELENLIMINTGLGSPAEANYCTIVANDKCYRASMLDGNQQMKEVFADILEYEDSIMNRNIVSIDDAVQVNLN